MNRASQSADPSQISGRVGPPCVHVYTVRPDPRISRGTLPR